MTAIFQSTECTMYCTVLELLLVLSTDFGPCTQNNLPANGCGLRFPKLTRSRCPWPWLLFLSTYFDISCSGVIQWWIVIIAHPTSHTIQNHRIFLVLPCTMGILHMAKFHWRYIQSFTQMFDSTRQPSFSVERSGITRALKNRRWEPLFLIKGR